jgi:hypothetical protein
MGPIRVWATRAAPLSMLIGEASGLFGAVFSNYHQDALSLWLSPRQSQTYAYSLEDKWLYEDDS